MVSQGFRHILHRTLSLRASVEELEQCGTRVDHTTLADLLRRCAKAKALSDGRRVHARIVKQRFDRNTFLANLLVQMYGSCGRVEEAHAVFGRIEERNVFSWNIMFAAYAQNGHLSDARDLFERMPQRDPVSWNAMITAYAQKGHLQQAKSMFDETPQHDLVTWNAMIAAYAQNGNGKDALDLFRLMQIEGVLADNISVTSALDACADLSAIAEGKAIHAEIVESRFSPDRRVHNSLINMYGKCGCLRDAEELFYEMPERDVVSWTAMMLSYSQNGHLLEAGTVFDRMPQRDTMAWNTLIIEYARNDNLENARSLFESLPEENSVSSTTMIAAYAQTGHLQDARNVFDDMLKPDLVAWNAIIASHVQHSSFREALKLFRMMDLEGVESNRITFISALHAAGRVAVVEVGKVIHDEIIVSNCQSDITLVVMLINMYGRCGYLERARGLFDELPQENNLLWNTMITVYAQNGQGNKSLELFHEMDLAGVQADEITFISVLSACSHTGLLRDGWEYFTSMSRDYGIAPIKDHYGCMVDLMGRTGQLDKAEDLITNMPFEPDVVTWTSLVGACRVHRDVKRGLRLSEHVFDLNPGCSSPYMLVSNIFSGSAAECEGVMAASAYIACSKDMIDPITPRLYSSS